MRPKKFTQKDIVELFYKQKILTKRQLTQTYGCSNMTAWRIILLNTAMNLCKFVNCEILRKKKIRCQ